MAALTVDSLPVTPRRGRGELALVPSPSAPGERAMQLHREARRASVEHLERLRQAIETAQSLAQEVVDGGDLYAVGVHDLARRLTEDLFWRAKSLQALSERQLAPGAH